MFAKNIYLNYLIKYNFRRLSQFIEFETIKKFSKLRREEMKGINRSRVVL